METNKTRQFEKLHNNFQSLSEKVMSQLILVQSLLENPTQSAAYQEIENNENLIDILENEVRIEFANIMLLFNPKAKELRKAISYQDVTNFLENCGDLLFDISLLIKKINFDLSDFNNLFVTLKTIFDFTKKILSNALFAFFYEDKSIAYKTIDELKEIESTCADINDKILLNFQELPLNEEELTNIININNICQKISEVANISSCIAQSAIYLIDGKDIRHAKVKQPH